MNDTSPVVASMLLEVVAVVWSLAMLTAIAGADPGA